LTAIAFFTPFSLPDCGRLTSMQIEPMARKTKFEIRISKSETIGQSQISIFENQACVWRT